MRITKREVQSSFNKWFSIRAKQILANLFQEPFLENASNKRMIVAHQKAVSENSFFSAIGTERVRQPRVQICLPRGERHEYTPAPSRAFVSRDLVRGSNSYTYDTCV